jgi:1,4-alpha-glucan branching enzyme
MAPVLREDVRIGLPQGGRWREVLNSDAVEYGGTGAGNGGFVSADGEGWHGQPVSASVTLPPLSALILAPDD